MKAMSPNRMKLGLATALVLLLGASASAQGLRDMELFGLVDQSRYGGGYRANEGYFFSFEGLVWHLSSPEATDIGKDNLTTPLVVYVPPGGFPDDPVTGLPDFPLPQTIETNSLSTSVFENKMAPGQRYDFGCVHGHNGWLFSGFRLCDFNESIYASNSSVRFEDAPVGPAIPVLNPDTGVADTNLNGRLDGYYDVNLTTGGQLPVTFDEMIVHNSVQIWGVEMNYFYRAHPFHNGGFLEFKVGARYLEFNELFDVDGIGGILDESIWWTNADNHIVGPQVGLRWFRRQNRWTWSVESRFFAGFNSQSIDQSAILGTNIASTITAPSTPGTPVKFTSTVRNEREHNLDSWSPITEFRVDLDYQLTRAVTFRVGWSGMWMNGIARPSDMIDYALNSNGSVLGILDENNRQEVFLNGFTIGVAVNR